jgi:hypothetical protein
MLPVFCDARKKKEVRFASPLSQRREKKAEKSENNRQKPEKISKKISESEKFGEIREENSEQKNYFSRNKEDKGKVRKSCREHFIFLRKHKAAESPSVTRSSWIFLSRRYYRCSTEDIAARDGAVRGSYSKGPAT